MTLQEISFWLDLVSGCKKSYAMPKVVMELHLLHFLAQPFVSASYLEGEFTMKLSSMRKNGTLDFYLPLDILLPLLLQQLMLFAQWRYGDAQLMLWLFHVILLVTNC